MKNTHILTLHFSWSDLAKWVMWVTLVGDGTGKCLVAPTEELLAQ